MPSPLVFLQITDLHILAESGQTMAGINTEAIFQQVLKAAHKQHGKVDCILVTGDLAQSPCQSSYQRISHELSKYKTHTLCLPGNHDDLALMQQFINAKNISCDKQMEFDHWQLISLNSKKEGEQGGYLAKSELELLENTLLNQPSLNAIIAVHHHPVPSNSSWMDTMMIENSDALFSTLKKHPQVKAIVCGHIHQQLEITKNNIQILGTPATCFQFKPKCNEYTLDDEKPGYRIIKLYPDGVVQSKVYRL